MDSPTETDTRMNTSTAAASVLERTTDPALRVLATLVRSLVSGEKPDLQGAMEVLELAAKHENGNQVSHVTDSIINELRKRDATGVVKYGVTLDRTDLSLDQWMQHLIEELMDAVHYARRAQMMLRQLDVVEQLTRKNFFLSGPNASAVVFNAEHIEPVIAALVAKTGDDPEDYTATDLTRQQAVAG